jgi:hypothetical protein
LRLVGRCRFRGGAKSKYWPTAAKGRFIQRNKYGTVPPEIAMAAGQDLEPRAAALVLANEELKKALAAAQIRADAKVLEDARAAISPPPEPVKPSLFEKKAEHASLSPAEKLGRNLDLALDIDEQIMQLGVDRDDPKTTRLVGEASGRTLSTATRVDEAQLRREDYRLKNLDKLAGLLNAKYDDAGQLKPKVIEHEPGR